MGSTRRSFTEEYEAKAVTFVIDDHRSIAEVARNIDVHEMTLGFRCSSLKAFSCSWAILGSKE
jgi:transposase-like protein